jgi:hypothetical protein
MGAQVMVTVKDADPYTKNMSVSMTDKLFHPIKSSKETRAKAKILFCVEGEDVQALEASKTPYVFEVAPGKHRLAVEDPKRLEKQGSLKAVVTVFTGIGGFANGGAASTVTAGAAGGALAEGLFNAAENVIEFEVSEGDVFKIQCHPTLTGKVSVKVLK